MLEGSSSEVYRPCLEGASGFWAVRQRRSVSVVQRLMRLRTFWRQGYSVLTRSVSEPQGQIILPQALPCPASCRLQPGLVSIQPAALRFPLQRLPTLWRWGWPNEAPRPVLALQGSLVFNRILLKMLPVSCPESPGMTLWGFSPSHQNPQLEWQPVSAAWGLSRWWDGLSPVWLSF